MKIDELKREINDLIHEGNEIAKDLSTEIRVRFTIEYEAWYSKALRYVKSIVPEREDDFISLYKLENR